MSHVTVFALKNPAVANEVRDAPTEGCGEGARTLLAQAIKAEALVLTRNGDQRNAAVGTEWLFADAPIQLPIVITGPA